MSSVTPTASQNHYFTRFSSKRKLEDAESSSNSQLRKCNSSNKKGKFVVDHELEPSSSSSSAAVVGVEVGVRGGDHRALRRDFGEVRLPLQFFVKMLSGGETLVLRAQFEDTVEMVHERIQDLTGVPALEQRLIYRGKQLEWFRTLKDCGLETDAGLQLVARMRSTEFPWAWKVIGNLVSIISRICRKEWISSDPLVVKIKLDQFMAALMPERGPFAVKIGGDNFAMMSGLPSSVLEEIKDDNNDPQHYRGECCRVFMDASAPECLIMLYMSKEPRNQKCADQCIRSFVGFLKDLQGDNSDRGDKTYYARMVLEFCRLLRMMVNEEDLLYIHCRSTLGSMVQKVGSKINGVGIGDMFPFFKEIGDRLLKGLKQSAESNIAGSLHRDVSIAGSLHRDVSDFAAFLQPMASYIDESKKDSSCNPTAEYEVKQLRATFDDLLEGIDDCLKNVELTLDMTTKNNVKTDTMGWAHYLPILKELYTISSICPGAENKFWVIVREHKKGVCGLVVKHAMRSDDHEWLSKHDDVLDFESRRHLALLCFPDMKEEYGEFLEMLIERSNLLAESFEYISGAVASDLHSGLFMEFKNEEATGPGVLREWFCLVTQAIFDPRNALFVSCPLDRRRFFPSAASKVDPLHYRYFQFSGRVIALALMHKIQIGIVLDRVLFLQLAGKHVSIEDIQTADPCMYSSCKQILEMDAAFVDSDGLGLTFATEVEELGTRKVVELCDGGKDIAVNSENRKRYVDLLVNHYFVKSIEKQVQNFAEGFSDILCKGKFRENFFANLKLEDFDWMLRGSENEICVEDWKSHTEYNGYAKSDRQIVWFWEVVGQLNAEQKRTLLFFWTSLKYLPVEGFRGLASLVQIYKSFDSQDCLPTSHTCFYRLCIPEYASKAVMRKRLLLITQEHLGCSFGTY